MMFTCVNNVMLQCVSLGPVHTYAVLGCAARELGQPNAFK